MKKSVLLSALSGLFLSFLFQTSAQAASVERVRVTTNYGAFVIEMQRDRAPLTVENFLFYVKSGYYTNTLFHRTIANFVIQGGGVGLDYKSKPTQKPIANEAGNGLKNLRGTVGLARASGPHSGDCQIYVNVADNADLDPLPTRWGYAVFGKIIEGMEVIDRISISPTGAMGPFKQDAPLEPVIIQKAELITEQTTVTPAPASATPVSPTPPPAENTIPADEASKGAAPAGKETPPPPAPPPK